MRCPTWQAEEPSARRGTVRVNSAVIHGHGHQVMVPIRCMGRLLPATSAVAAGRVLAVAKARSKIRDNARVFHRFLIPRTGLWALPMPDPFPRRWRL